MVAPLATAPPDAFVAFTDATKPLFPIPALLFIIPILYAFFRKDWRQLDLESQEERGKILASGGQDLRPLVALVVCALVFAMQEYYGGRGWFEEAVRPKLTAWANKHATSVEDDPLYLRKFDELWGFVWWAGTRVGGYLLPFAVWKCVFPKDSLLDMGLRVRGFFTHAWIYGLFLAVVLPAMFVVSSSPDFGSYYPFYKHASRSWLDLLLWEGMYFAQFFALELFFRGFWLSALKKSMGSGAIFCMAVPYCMIHFGKPYLEAVGAIVAGIALGSLSAKTKSIYQGFLVHVTVAALMDGLSLAHRHALPTNFWP